MWVVGDLVVSYVLAVFFFQAEDGIRDDLVTGVQTCALPIYEETVRQAQVVQQQLQAIGIKATINSPEWAQWLELEGKGNYQTYLCGWIGLTDADSYFFLQHRTGEAFNFTGYSNPAFDKLVDQGLSISALANRYKIYKQANKILVDDAPYIYFYSPTGLRAYKPFVKGFLTRPDLQNNLWNVWLDK